VTGEGFPSTLAAAQAGAEWAVAVLYRAHNPRVLRYLRARAGQDADDVASATWLDAARNLRSFAGTEDDFRGWLFSIARRRLIDHLRRQGRRPSDSVDPTVLAEVTSATDVAEEAIADIGDEAARRLVSGLPAEQADIVLLRVVAGLSVAEVAVITGRRPGTVRVLQHRALRRLARELPPRL
jgi:RNA polymerase sigma-70 factor (ECF subfamily)